MWKEFKQFALRGNLVDLTIGFVIGNAFSKVVTSIVNDIIMPPLGLFIGHVDFSNLYINLSRKHYASFAAAQAAGAPTINIGTFLNNVVNFLIVAVVMFVVVRNLNRLAAHRRREAEVKTARLCPYCIQEIADDATRCPHCTSHLTEATTHGDASES
ncbi:large conductance mechanosensitive channel protein MscL [Alicyclobacillus fastidiosus]|uniref:Large-conductance mechanosensitive channel n=1 Tax=Alicyclobacillus fastidiosus TaxID=392011 RepID=A0ABY6ZFR4_9BACL|nr:large conductance mechanosensitive channel protein MscL [Alicyclobacillus fastidiosus]WAH41682.1 large conductance mechanosensitive channel protein MscL [Alicyclobacillus fastidiosus]GMA63361.1 large-conductance mechanosensitive channel [Alicyclobacillus fastidiosus]